MSRIQLKLAAALAGLASAVTLAGGYLAESGLRARQIEQIEQSLDERSRLVIESLGDLPFEPERAEALYERAAGAAHAANARVTFIARGGRVVADSGVAPADLARVENHADRPEVRAALEGRVESSTRLSQTVGRPMLYRALPLPGESGAVVRLAVDLSQVDAAVAGLRRELLIAGAIGLAAAAALAFVLSGLLLRPLDVMRRTLASLADGKLDQRVRSTSRDELGQIADAIDHMGEQLELRLAELVREKEQLQAVLRGMVEGVLVIDGHGRITLANRRLRELFDLPEDVEGTSPLEAIRHAELESLLLDAAAGDAPVLRELDFSSPRPRTVRVHAASLEDTRAGGVVAVFQDVTEVRRLEAARRDFVANASHELRTPLTAIQGFAETLVSRDLPAAERKRYLGILYQHSERLGQLIENLLELSHVESGRRELERVDVDLRSEADRALERMRPRFEERSIRTRLVTGPGAGESALTARADPRAVDQVLENLLDNAIKYTEPGGNVELRVSLDGDRVRIDVADDGIGIPREDCARIFERFYRVDKARSRALGGTGLGLAIVRHLVESMGGEVSVKSTPGAGSVFSVSLPRSP
ncbi:MAG: HAMP domain-containing protein [Deltaproteobacteria bacterium]|nr:HAMP domain-containing protein [Deltaproteobacteria bacterium]MBW2415246.1 HAMP domain-containing protein [Deltaproteobacteria bacterium]